MRYQIFPPRPELAHLLLHILVIELDDCELHLPAGLNPSVMLLIKGRALVREPNNTMTESLRFFLRGPFMSPVNVCYAPGTLSLSFCFRAGMLHQATGLSAAGLLEQVVDMAQIFNPGQIHHFLQDIEQEDSTEGYVARLQELLLQILDHRKKTSIGASFLAAHQKMFFPLLQLSLDFGIGQRQLERRVRDAFGVPLRDVRRLARFGQCLPRLIGHRASWGDLTSIALDSGYYDQAHMYKEFTELAGISPALLLQKIAGNDPAYWLYRLNRNEFKNLFLPV